jgi:hypothetical protein
MVAQLKDYGWRWEQENKAAFKANEERKDLLQELQEARNQLLMIKDKNENGLNMNQINAINTSSSISSHNNNNNNNNNTTTTNYNNNNKKQIETPRINQPKPLNKNATNENKKHVRKTTYLPRIYNNGTQPSPKSETSITSDVYENSLI